MFLYVFIILDDKQEGFSKHKGEEDVKTNHDDDSNLEIIKIKTLYNIVEDLTLTIGKRKLLFLTNLQADVLTNSPTGVQKLIAILTESDTSPPPKLFIELVHSRGNMFITDKTGFARKVPFPTPKERRQSDMELVMFMQKIIIPLAAENNAVIICQARGKIYYYLCVPTFRHPSLSLSFLVIIT